MKKINLVEILKDCPKGMELDCMMLDNVVFEKIDFSSSHHPIIIRRTDSNKTIHLTKYGQYSTEEDYKCIIFPKGKTTWEGFVPPCKFKDGDIISDSLGTCIFKGEGTIKGTVDYYCGISGVYFSVKNHKQYPNVHFGNIVAYRFAFEEEKEKLFKVIKANGYRWNPDNKTFEKLPKFKVGDRIQNKQNGKQLTITKVCQDCYECDDRYVLTFKKQDNWELIPNKFDINTLKPFKSRVLVRNSKDQYWIPAFWGFRAKDGYVTTFGHCNYCIPFMGNEHLLDTTDDCDEYYKTWE